MSGIEPHQDDVLNPVSPPSPRSALFWDGTHWRVPRADTHGRVQVRSEDQLFSIESVLALHRGAIISGVDGFIDSLAVPPGEYWLVTTAMANDITSAVTAITIGNRHDGNNIFFHEDIHAFVIAERTQWAGVVPLDVGDTIRAYFTGGLAGDNVGVTINGYRMTVET